MERDKNFSDRTPSHEQEPVPQKCGNGDVPSVAVDNAAAVPNDAKEGMKNASGKLPRGDV